MKSTFLILLTILLFIGCGQDKLTKKQTVIHYFNARNSVDFEKVKDLINDSITIIEGTHFMPYSQDSFYEVFKWDSVFQTTYEIVELEELEEQVIASTTLSSIRNEFLQENQMTCKYKLSFTSEKISKIESLDCIDADWEMWQKRVNSLVNWIEKNHPQYNSFIHDMTMQGAKNYVKAIKLYQENNNDL